MTTNKFQIIPTTGGYAVENRITLTRTGTYSLATCKRILRSLTA